MAGGVAGLCQAVVLTVTRGEVHSFCGEVKMYLLQQLSPVSC